MKKIAMVAFGGNALLRSGQKGTYQEQLANVEQTCEQLFNLVKQGYFLAIGHGNGPQVGTVMLQQEAGRQMFDLASMPMDYCGAQTQGAIAYMIEQGMARVLVKNGLNRRVVSLVTQVVVDKNDPLFQNPTKPVGPYVSKEEADQYHEETGDIYREDPKGNGWRKVVASPKPVRINNIEIIRQLVEVGNIVITVGGGGIPVIEEDGMYTGVEAVIDKDLASALCASQIRADALFILTDVPKVYLNFRKPGERALDVITVDQAKQYLAEGHFTEGSMAPKIRAGIFFVEHGGKECIITEAGQLDNPACGTRIIRQ